MNRKEILEQAAAIVCQDREEQYGKPENSFATIAELWTTYFRAAHEEHIGAFRPEDVGMMMALLKVARIAAGQPKADNFIDLAGYTACAGEIALREDCGNESQNRIPGTAAG